MKRIVISLFFVFVALRGVYAQTADAEGSLVKWMDLKEAMAKEEVQPKPIVMDFYTDWCGWCKQMMRTTYATPDVANYINANFYAVKFNAEGKDTIDYLGEKYMPTSKEARTTHPLAAKLLQNKLMYPTTLYLNNYDKKKKEFGFNMMAQGYMDDKKVEPILVFMLENAFRNSGFDEFNAEFQKAFFDPKAEEKFKEIKWMNPSEVFGKIDSSKKKTMVVIHTDWCNACRVMYKTSFDDSLTEAYLKEKYNLVDFNPEAMDTLTYKGKTYTNQRTQQRPFHDLAVELCRNSITLPSLVILDEKMNITDAIPFYLNPQVLKSIAVFYGDDIYKKKSWNEYMTGK